LLIETPGEGEKLFELPADAVLEVPITHPTLPWFADLKLKWHALPAVSNMALETGGVTYPAAPFSGYYMETEIAARNFGDTTRYNLLPVVAGRMDPAMRSKDPFWRDRALVELCAAVLHSFRQAGVTIVDHHAASRQFTDHLEEEQAQGRIVPGDWSWLVPPVSGSASPVFHRSYDPRPRLPDFVPRAAGR
jgi:nitric-oxide synthase